MAQSVIDEASQMDAERTQIDPRTRKRTMPMKILIIGMMRTGTFSMMKALGRLGYKCYHMRNLITNPPDCKMWKQAYDAKYFGKGKPLTREEWDMLLGETNCCLDIPTAAFMPELIAAYPEAKVIVSERDADKWYASCQATIMAIPKLALLPLMLLDTAFFAQWTPIMHANDTGTFGPAGMRDAQHAKDVYRRLHREVRALVPRERRLEFQLKDGWGPLCEFLGKKVPEGEAFPHVNDTETFVRRVQVMVRLAYWRVAKKLRWVGVAGLVVWGAYTYPWKRQ